MTPPPQPCPRCGDTHPGGCRPEALLDKLLAGRYRLIGVVGEGGMGTVYEAEHVDLARRVALKLMHPRMDAGEQTRLRFEREARAAAATGHENVVDVFDLGRDERGAPFLVMELLEGVDLGRAIHHVGRLPARRSAWIVGQVLAALEAVHSVGIHHRDLKPDNVFLTKRAGISDWVKVLDFGVAEFANGTEEPTTGKRKMAAGTLHYMAPEQASGAEGQDARVDVYAAGVLLYECLSGEIPFEAASARALRHAVIANAFSPLDSHVPDLDPALARLVHGAMARSPEDRPASARAFFDALRPFGAGSPPGPPQLTPARGLPRPAIISATLQARARGTVGTITAPPSDGARSSNAAGWGPGADPTSAVFAPRPRHMADHPQAFHRGSTGAAHAVSLDTQSSSRERKVYASGAHPTQLVARSETLRFRGRWVHGIVANWRETRGASAHGNTLASLPGPTRAVFAGVLLPTAWVEADDLGQFLRAAKVGTGARNLGRLAAEAAATGPNSPPSIDLRTWADSLRNWLRGVSPEVTPLPGGLSRLTLMHDGSAGAEVSAALSGMLEAFALRADGDVVSVGHSMEADRGIASVTLRLASA